MRRDMAKVIVERPRPGSSRHVPRRFARLDPKHIPLTDDDLDPFPSRLGHRRAARLAGDWKVLNENLTPLRRFLLKQAGRPWNKVWSEISAHVRADSTVQKHVRDHIQDFVANRTFLRNSQVFVASRLGPRTVADLPWLALYVDPRTGLLCRNKAYGTSWRRRTGRTTADAQGLAERLRVLAPDRQLHLLGDGNWWEVMLAAEPQPGAQSSDGPPVDVIERAGLSNLPRAARYDRHGVYAAAKRPLSRKEIKARGLRP